MGTLYNVLHANEIAHERDFYKRTSAGLGLSTAGILVGALVGRHKLKMRILEVEERIDSLERERQKNMYQNATPPIWTNPNGEIPSMPVAATEVKVETLTDVVPDPSPKPLDEFFEVDLDNVKEAKDEEKKPETKETKTTKGGKK
jgi:hypothetical protein